MRLSELEPEFLKITGSGFKRIGVNRDEADGIYFLCPKCFTQNNGAAGTHSIICWRPGVPQTIAPYPGRWELVGTSFEDLSLVANPTSVQLMSGCNAHFTVSNGNIIRNS